MTRLKLRGHHIGTFAIEFFGEKLSKPIDFKHENESLEYKYHHLLPEKYCFPYLENKNIIKNKEFYREKKRFGEEKGIGEEDSADKPEDAITRLYGRRMKAFVDVVYALLKSKPDMEVEIVEGLDSVCLADCPLRLSQDCADPFDEDAFTLRAYGLEAGKVYTAREIVQKVEDFSTRTGITSPRIIYYMMQMFSSSRKS